MNKTIMVLAVLPLFVTGCAKDCGGTFDKWFGRSDCKVESNTGTQTSGNNTATDTEIENKIVVSVDTSPLDPTKKYKLSSAVNSIDFDKNVSTQTISTELYKSEDAKSMTLVSVRNEFGELILLAPITKDQKSITINLDTTAQYILLTTSKMMGVRVTNYTEFSDRTQKFPEFQEIKTAILDEIKSGSHCPISCNSAADRAADTLMDKIDVTDIITAEGV